MIRVVAIEDDRDIAGLIKLTLDAGGIGLELAMTGSDGVATVKASRPDVVLLDLDLPDADGLDLIEDLTAVAPVLVLTGRRSEDSIVTGLELGADDYITKPFSPRVLRARVEAAARRRTDRAGAATVIRHGALEIDLERRTATVHGQHVDLTRRELDLLAYLAARPGVVVSRQELLESVWQSSSEWQTAATVTEHVRRIRLKLGDDRWITNQRGVGYRFEPR